jgi:hypothetical protein
MCPPIGWAWRIGAGGGNITQGVSDTLPHASCSSSRPCGPRRLVIPLKAHRRNPCTSLDNMSSVPKGPCSLLFDLGSPHGPHIKAFKGWASVPHPFVGWRKRARFVSSQCGRSHARLNPAIEWTAAQSVRGWERRPRALKKVGGGEGEGAGRGGGDGGLI